MAVADASGGLVAPAARRAVGGSHRSCTHARTHARSRLVLARAVVAWLLAVAAAAGAAVVQ